MVHDLRARGDGGPSGGVEGGPVIYLERAAAGGVEHALFSSPCSGAEFHLMAARSVLEVKKVNRSLAIVFVNIFLLLPKELALLLLSILHILNSQCSDDGYVGIGLVGQSAPWFTQAHLLFPPIHHLPPI